MGSVLQIRDAPDETRRLLKTRAAARGESLNSFLLDVLSREAARPTVAQVLDRAARRAERASESVVETIAAARTEREEELQRRSWT